MDAILGFAWSRRKVFILPSPELYFTIIQIDWDKAFNA